MHLPLPALLDVLWALDEETRLRIAVLLQHGELTVTDLTDILGMSQPRVSRHLKLLAEAGVVDKHREGTWAFFDLETTGPIGQLVQGVLALTDASDSVLAADLDRLTIVRSRRAAAAQEYFAGIAARWDEERSLHASDAIVEQAILETIGTTPYTSVLDVGTGTGRMLQLLAKDAKRAVGFDSSHSMLAVARANLERAEIRGVDLRQGDIYSPPLANDSFDLSSSIRCCTSSTIRPGHSRDQPSADARRAVAGRRLRAARARVPALRSRPSASRLPRRQRRNLARAIGPRGGAGANDRATRQRDRNARQRAADRVAVARSGSTDRRRTGRSKTKEASR